MVRRRDAAGIDDRRRPAGVPDAVRDEIERIHAGVEAALPLRACERRTTCCRFAETGREPWITDAELAHLVAHVRSQGRRIPPPRADGNCPLLGEDERTCTVYSARPLGCRTHFCRAAGGDVTARSLRAELHALAALDERTSGGLGGRPLRRALEAARRGRSRRGE